MSYILKYIESSIALWRWLLIISYSLVCVFFVLFLTSWNLVWPFLASCCFFLSYYGIGFYVTRNNWKEIYWNAGYLRAIRGGFVSILIYFAFPGFFLSSMTSIILYLSLLTCMICLAAFRGIHGNT